MASSGLSMNHGSRRGEMRGLPGTLAPSSRRTLQCPRPCLGCCGECSHILPERAMTGPRTIPTSLRAEPACPPTPVLEPRVVPLPLPSERRGFQGTPDGSQHNSDDLEHNCEAQPSPLAQGLTLLLVAASLLEQGSVEFRGSHGESGNFTAPPGHRHSPWISTATRRVWTPQKPFPGCRASGREGRMQRWGHEAAQGKSLGSVRAPALKHPHPRLPSLPQDRVVLRV